MEPNKVRKLPCPPDLVWARLAAGAIAGAEAESLTAHASECPDCARTLRAAIDTLTSDDGETEQGDEIDIKTLAASMAQVHSRRWIGWRSGIVAAALLLVGGWFLLLRPAAPPLDLLAAAYSNPRTLEFRIAGASYAPRQVQRGEDAVVGAPEFHESLGRILRATSTGAADSGWLHAKGRAELLQGHFDAAIQSFKLAAHEGAGSPDFLIDFGVAYASRASRLSTSTDYTSAIELLTQALAHNPRNPAALFNRALAEDRLAFLDSAIRDLENCVAAETDAGWRQEAQSLLDELRKKRAKAFATPRELPDELRAEAGFERLLREGLSAAELRALAPILKQAHGDRWLTEVASSNTAGGQAARAIAALSAMAGIRSKSRREEYAKLQSEIDWLSAAALSEPLGAWRSFELLASESNRQDKTLCLSRSAHLPNYAARAYWWFAIQSALEISTCYSAEGSLDAAERSTNSAIGWAQQARYGTAEVRARGFLASHLGNEGRYRESIETSSTALAGIVAGRYPLDRAYQFYRNLAAAAERLERWQCARAATEMSVAVARHTGLTTLEMLGTLTLAEFSFRAGEREAARTQFLAAEKLAASLSLDSEVALFRAYSSALLRALEGDHAGAVALERQVLASRNLFLDARYLNVLSELELRSDRPEAARDHALEAIGRIASKPDEGRRFRDYDARASRSLVRAYVALKQYPAALEAWRGWTRRDRNLMGARRSAQPGETGVHTITIVPLDERIGIFAQAGNDVQFSWSALTAGEGLGLVRRLRTLCANFRSDPQTIRAVARQLLSGLQGDGKAFLPKGDVRLEAVGEWTAIPLLALIEDETAAYRLPASERSGCGAFSRELAVVQADAIGAEFQKQLPRLPHLEREAGLLRSTVPGAALLTGGTLTPRAVADAGAHSRWLHFSGHAVRLGNTAMLVAAPDPGAALEEERRGLWKLRPSERLCSDLIFFAACSTGVFKEMETIAPAQLADAALMAGARAALAALWDVDSEATTELAANFYSALRSGTDPARSLHEAARLLRRDARYSHPYYWAAFVLFEA